MDIASVINLVRLAALAAAKCGQHALYFKQNSVVGYSPIFENKKKRECCKKYLFNK